MYWYSRQTGYFIWSQIIHSKECNGKDNIILLRYRIIVGLLGICCIAASQTLLICICLQSIMQRWKLQKSSSKMVQLWVKLFFCCLICIYTTSFLAWHIFAILVGFSPILQFLDVPPPFRPTSPFGKCWSLVKSQHLTWAGPYWT